MVFATSSSSFSSLRAPILRLAKLGTAYPIEAIVTFFCAATLVYFQLIKVSDTLFCTSIANRGVSVAEGGQDRALEDLFRSQDALAQGP